MGNIFKMKKLLSFLLVAFMAITTAMAQDICDAIGQTIQEAKTLVSQGNTTRALNYLKNAQKIDDLKNCPNYSRLAEEIRRIESQQQSSGSSSSGSSSSSGQTITVTANDVTFTMVAVKGGTFQMGATSEQGSDAESDEKPAHRVTLSDYYIGQTEVTQALWQAVMGTNPSNWKGSNLPVEKVSWDACQQFITKLNQITGRRFRLPTEAEWEFAARGGNKSRGYKYSGSNDIGAVAWYWENSGKMTHSVGQKQANELGIYDMTGNVWEWCQDWYDKEYYGKSPSTNPCNNTSASCRVDRGGSWNGSARSCRVSNRYDDSPDNADYSLGLRLAM